MASNHKRQKRRKRRSTAVVVLLIVCAVLAAGVVGLSIKLASQTGGINTESAVPQSSLESSANFVFDSEQESTSYESDDASSDASVTATPTPTPEPLPAVTLISPDSIVSHYGYMERQADGALVLDKASSDRMYPASMTKVMSTLVVLENLTDLDEKLVITTEVMAALYEAHSSLAGFAEGESVCVRDLLYGAMLPSGGEAIVTLANRVAGSESAFADLMNQKAAELGLTSTHFTNSTGLHSDDQYTTCYEMAKILEAALQNETFYEIAKTSSHTCEPTDYHPEGLVVNSTLSEIEGMTFDNGAVILGGKTGTTDEAGYCLASFGTYGDQTYVLVTGYAEYTGDGVRNSIEDAKRAYALLQ